MNTENIPVNFLGRPNEVHVMVDIETLDTTPTACITEIGAVCLNSCSFVDSYFHMHVLDEGYFGTTSQETLDWRTEKKLFWMTKHSNGSIHSARELPVALGMFFSWLEKLKISPAAGLPNRELVMWCKGTDFDKIILQTAVERSNSANEDSKELAVPWKYNKFFDVRTLLNIFPQFKISKEQVTHCAVEDAELQADQLRKLANYVYELEITQASLE